MLTAPQAIGTDSSHLVEFSDCLGNTHLVHPAIIADLSRLTDAAKNAGLPIAIVSGYRNFDRQLAIWNGKWQGHRPVFSRHGRPVNMNHLSDIERYKAISLWSALPGFSRHHWGTDLDIFSANAIRQGYQAELTSDEFSAGGPCEALDIWMQSNLGRYGFFRPYREYRQGVSAEPWHISHLEVASEVLANFDFNACKAHILTSDIVAKQFIEEHLSHYQNQYFCNICEAE